MNAHNEQQSIIAGALFDLMGYLTCREKKLHLSASDDAAPAVEALTEWAEERGFDLDKARVTDWQAALAAQPSPVVKQNLTTQPAAAQEAVAVVDGPDRGAAISSTATLIRAMPSGTKLFAAPVTAAPVAIFQERSTHSVYRGSCGSLPCYCWAENDHIIGDEVKRYRTPAAPGIDLSELHSIASDLSHSAKVDDYEPQQIAFIESIRDRLCALIDASPKGATLNEQFGSVERLGSASGREAHYRQALERIATQGPHYGPDGTRETWKHWSDIARDALVDSPKGGSERGHFQDRLADIEGRPRTEREPEDDEEGCLHEFVAFRSDCIHCGKAYVPPQAGDAEVQP